MPSDSLKQKTISSLFWKFLERFGSAFASLVVQVVMARLLMPEDYGSLAIILVFINLGDIVVKSGLTSALVQAPRIKEDDFSTVFWISCVLAVLICAVIFFIAPAIAAFYNSNAIIWPLRVMGLLLLLSSFNGVQWAKVARDLAFKKTFISTVVSVVCSGTFGIVLALNGAALWALVGQQIVHSLINCIVLRAQVRWTPKLVFHANRAKELFMFGWKLLASGFLTTLCQSFANLVIGKQFSTNDLGLMSQGEKIPNAVGRLIDGAIQPVMMSVVAHVQEDIEYVRRLMRRAIKVSAFAIYPIMGSMFVVAEPLVRVVLGEQWLPCVPFLQVNCLIYAQLVIQSSNLQTMIGMGRSGTYLKLEALNKFMNLVVILYTAFVLQNIYAYIIGGFIISFLTSWIDVYPNRKPLRYSYRDLIRDTAPAAGLTALAGICALPIAFIQLEPWLTLLLQLIVMVVVYLGVAKLLRLEDLEYAINTGKEYIRKK